MNHTKAYEATDYDTYNLGRAGTRVCVCVCIYLTSHRFTCLAHVLYVVFDPVIQDLPLPAVVHGIKGKH